jgi:hypothetical protein
MEYLQINRRLRDAHPGFLSEIVQDLQGRGASVSPREGSPWLWINDTYSASLRLIRCRHRGPGPTTWLVRINSSPPPDVTIIVRMDAANELPFDYYLFPRFGLDGSRLALRTANGCRIDTFRFDSLDFFKGMAVCQVIQEAA